jgi:DNA-binding LacI/PurR family transcriptional regulator
VLGIGLGVPLEEYSSFGENPDPVVRGDKLDEGLAVLSGLWQGEPFSFTGEHYWVSKVTDSSTVGAILVLACRLSDHSEELSRRGIPIVVVDQQGEAGSDAPTGIFAGSYLQAQGVYNALRTAGLAVPSDVSVVGFDDMPMAALTSPHLTTVRQPLADMGRMATNMLVQLVQRARLDSARVELATTLVTRESCALPQSA